MNLNDYKVNVKLPEYIMKTAIEESSSILNYRFYGKEYYFKGHGPQKIKSVSEDLKEKIDTIIGIEAKYADYLKCASNFIVLPHVDTYADSIRKSCLTWALSDPKSTSPTLFYDDNDNVIGKYEYDEYAFIIDTRIRHGIVNNNNIRILMQFQFDMEPFDLRDKIHAHLSSL